MNRIKAVIFDVDGTLYDYRQRRIPPSTVAAIGKLKEKGILVIVATARSYPELSEDLLGKIPADYFVCSGGHSIQDGEGRPLSAIRFSHRQVEIMKQLALELDAGLTLKYHDRSCLYRHPEEMYRIYSNIGTPRCPTVLCETMDAHDQELPLGFTIRGEGDIRERFLQALEAYPEDFRAEPYGNGTVADVYSPRANKMTALENLMGQLGILPENCIAFGDGHNDMEMIRWAGIGVAMGNGRDELKAAADLVCAAAWEDGIAGALEELKLIN